MKKIMKTSCILFASLAMTVSINAQTGFTYGSKKKTTPAKTAQDTVIAKPVTKPVTNNQVVTAPTFSELKPAKIIDTTVVGGFNANNRRSLRNGYAFFSETNSRKGVKERVPLPYENLREEDALFSEFVWEEIDAREKINRTFMYQSYDENGDQRFFAVLLRAIEKDGVVPFSTVDDRFTTPITLDEVNASLKGSLDTQLVQNVLDPNVYDTSIIYNTNLAPNPDSIYTFRLKEQWIFDSKTSSMYSRIIGIAPIASIQIGNKVVKRPLFWVYYPELRMSLAKAEVYNPRNISSRITWEELFESRYFNGYVVKSTLDNYNDKMLSALFKDPVKRLQEGEKIKQKIFDFEQDRWVY
jgi:gliding motility associated protien GldN